ncbi:putative MFS-type transporter y4rN [Streptomyces longisporoflavus]|uniref:MFS transporter n=1 Tax=Streptomyces longisporoflavus TaxID=28044 RepID=UPI00167E22BC|nr:MFS transporter [Streptomyces longisporoflavus]GGV40763.1 putative MFS-type transporter y4rN [Streptomyces longisporoflavus]
MLRLHLTAATLLRVSAEGVATALVLTVQSRTGDAASAGFVQTAMTLPYVLSGPVIGHALDRADRPRRLVTALACGYALATALLMLSAGRSPLVLVLLVAAVVGCVEPVVTALTGLLPRLVPARRLSRAYGLEASSYNVAAIAGPGLAALVAAFAGAGHSGIVIVAAAVLGTLALPLLSLPPPEVKPERSGLAQVMGGGFSVLGANRVLRALTVSTMLAWFGYGGFAVAAVLLGQDIGAGPAAGGQLLACFAVGSLVGALASSRRLTPGRAENAVLVGLLGFGTSLAALAVVPSLPWAWAVCVAAGLAEGPLFTATLMLRQRESPPDRLGQVNTTGGSLKIGASAGGAALTGVLAGRLGADGMMLGIAACQVAGAALWIVLRRLPASAAVTSRGAS